MNIFIFQFLLLFFSNLLTILMEHHSHLMLDQIEPVDQQRDPYLGQTLDQLATDQQSGQGLKCEKSYNLKFKINKNNFKT
jgi:hypothetical protein